MQIELPEDADLGDVMEVLLRQVRQFATVPDFPDDPVDVADLMDEDEGSFSFVVSGRLLQLVVTDVSPLGEHRERMRHP